MQPFENMIVKVCGMRDSRNIRETEPAGADWIGFIFYPYSSRFVSAVPEYLPEKADRVGVFVNEPAEKILDTVRNYGLNAVQLHGGESPGICRELREKGLRVIKAFSVECKDDLKLAAEFCDSCDYFLFDTRCRGYGGSGKKFDWTLLSLYEGSVPFLLSGGLGPDSLASLREFRHPAWAGVDLNSGFEKAPAVKDAESIGKFIKEFRLLQEDM